MLLRSGETIKDREGEHYRRPGGDRLRPTPYLTDGAGAPAQRTSHCAARLGLPPPHPVIDPPPSISTPVSSHFLEGKRGLEVLNRGRPFPAPSGVTLASTAALAVPMPDLEVTCGLRHLGWLHTGMYSAPALCAVPAAERKAAKNPVTQSPAKPATEESRRGRIEASLCDEKISKQRLR